MPLDVVLGAQWGDEGKGRIVDYLAKDADIVARFAGGDNAGHTVAVDGKVFKLHIIPSGIVRGKICVLGNGMVINTEKLSEEIMNLRSRGISIENTNLIISDRAHVIRPYHIEIDKEEERESDLTLGTTQRGIGPAYTDKISRGGEFIGKLWENYLFDTSDYLNASLNTGKTVLVEGAQGTMLDIDHGDYPYVTSSNCTIGGVFTGLGVSPKYLNRTIGVVKAFSTRIGAGPFDTEIFDEDLINHFRGDGSKLGDEFGTTTGRPRRIGWLDLDQVKYACRINGFTEIALTKLDIMSGLSHIKVYYKGAPVSFPGWMTDITDAKYFHHLPEAAKEYVNFIVGVLKTPITLISVGPYREQIIDHCNE